MKDKKTKTFFNGFVKIVNESNCKPIKLWGDQRGEFYNSLISKWLDDNDILMYSIDNEVMAVVAERFIRTLKGKIYTKMKGNNSKSYIDYLNKSLDKQNNSFRGSIGKAYYCSLFYIE